MDTVHFTANGAVLRDEIQENMKLIQDEDSFGYGESKDEHYLLKKYMNCRFRGGLFEIKYNDDPNKKWDKFQLITHLSHFKSFYDFLDGFKALTGRYFQTAFHNLKITRFDFCVDVKRDFDTLVRSFQKNGAREFNHYEHKQGKRSWYWGSKRRSHIKIYEKVEKDVKGFDCNKDLRSEHQQRKLLVVRIEQVLKGKNLPFRTLAQMVDVVGGYNFFKGVSFLDHNSTYDWIQDEKTRFRVQAFNYLVSQKGFSEAKKSFSQNRNFSRDIGQYLVNKELLNINLLVQTRLHRMFELEDLLIANDTMGLKSISPHNAKMPIKDDSYENLQ